MRQAAFNIGKALTIICFAISARTAAAQFNVMIGYSGNFAQTEELDRIIQQYNETTVGLENRLPELNYLNGLVLGARYKISVVSLEAALDLRFQEADASGVDSLRMSPNFSRDLAYRYLSYSFGAESLVTPNFGFGGSIILDNFRMKTRTQAQDSEFQVIDAAGLSSQFYATIHLPGTRELSIGIRPFVHVTWTGFSLDALDAELNGANALGGALNERPLLFGLKFLFYNGKQSF